MKKKIKHFWNWLTDCKEFGNKPVRKYLVWLILVSAVLMFMFRIICIDPLINENRENSSCIEDSLNDIRSNISDVSRDIISLDTTISSK